MDFLRMEKKGAMGLNAFAFRSYRSPGGSYSIRHTYFGPPPFAVHQDKGTYPLHQHH